MERFEDKIVYRYFGIELRIVFYLASLFFLLLSLSSLRYSLFLSLVSFLLFILTALATYQDSKRHMLVLSEEELGFSRFFGTNKSGEKNVPWETVKKIATREYGLFKLLKITRIISEGREIKVFSFMEDYYHFLKDLKEKSKNAEIDKLTQDLLSGQADF